MKLVYLALLIVNCYFAIALINIDMGTAVINMGAGLFLLYAILTTEDEVE